MTEIRTDHLYAMSITIEGRKTPIYEVYNKEQKTNLGRLIFYPQWRQYVWIQDQEIIMSKSCLLDLCKIIERVQGIWRASLKGKPMNAFFDERTNVRHELFGDNI